MKSEKGYKLLLLDVDGTLIDGGWEGRVSKVVKKAIKSINHQIKVCLCTGRNLKELQLLISELEIGDNYHAIESGAKILNPQGEFENVKSIPLMDVKWILSEVGNNQDGIGICEDGIWNENLNGLKNNGIITTVALHSLSQKRTAELKKVTKNIAQKYHVAIGSHWQTTEGAMFLITHPEASKGLAIKYIQQKYDIAPEYTVGVGDMPNDIPMFAQCGLKVAIGNAHPELKQAADLVVKSIKDDGVADAVKQIFLN